MRRTVADGDLNLRPRLRGGLDPVLPRQPARAKLDGRCRPGCACGEGWRIVAAHVSVIDEPKFDFQAHPRCYAPPRNDADVYTAALCAMKARHPPNAEISRAPSTACASTRNPFTPRPSASAMRADRQRRRDRGDEPPKPAATAPRFRARSAAPCSGVDAQQARLRRRGRQAHKAGSPARWAWLQAGARRAPSTRHSAAYPRDARRRPRSRSRRPHEPAGSVASGGCATPRAPSGSPVSAWKTRPMLASIASLPGGREQRDAEGHAVRPHRRRQRQAAQIEQIDEVGIGAEPAVELDRVRQHLPGRIGRRRRRQHHRVDARRRRARRAFAAPAADRARRRSRPP